MNYEEMSDFDINKAVAEIKVSKWKHPAKSIEEDPLIDGAVLIEAASGAYCMFDPCNNPSDAWPIIVENNIALLPPLEDTWKARIHHISARDKNPLRAAMLVLLEMQK